MAPLLRDAGARIDAVFVTECSANGFPRLLGRDGEAVFVWFECREYEESLARCRERLARNGAWTGAVYPWPVGQCWRGIEMPRLEASISACPRPA